MPSTTVNLAVIDLKLQTWAAWRHRRYVADGLGYSNTSAIRQAMVYGCRVEPGFDHRPVNGVDFDRRQEEIEDAVNRLPNEYRAIVALRHLVNGREADKAQQLGVCSKTYQQRYREARLYLAGWFDRAQTL